jgi:hypothetical protein
MFGNILEAYCYSHAHPLLSHQVASLEAGYERLRGEANHSANCAAEASACNNIVKQHVSCLDVFFYRVVFSMFLRCLPYLCHRLKLFGVVPVYLS